MSVEKSLCVGDNEVDLWGLCQPYGVEGHDSLVSWVFKLKVEFVQYRGNDYARSNLSKSLSKAASLACAKRLEASILTFLSCGSEEIFAFRVESFRNELVGLFPLLRVVVDGPDVNCHYILYFQFNTM
jgi:hypothetical protein